MNPPNHTELREHLHEIAVRGGSDAWKDWARLQLIKGEAAR